MSDEIVHEEVVHEQPITSAARLRAFEDKTMGADAPRINGQLERGHGSLFQRLSPEQKHHYALLEKLVSAEEKVAHTSAALELAKVEHEAALKVADASEPVDGGE